MGEACEDIVGDVEPEALFEEESEAHGLVGTGAVETRNERALAKAAPTGQPECP